METILSPFSHLIEVSPGVSALWSSLWLRTLFLSGRELELVLKLSSDQALSAEELSHETNRQLLAILEAEEFLDPAQEKRKLEEVREALKRQNIGILYLVLTEGCNLACGYCFLHDMVRRELAAKRKMSAEVAYSSIDLFTRVIKKNGMREPEIIFYGGEPLLNWEVMAAALDYAARAMPTCKFTVNTNGISITPEIAQVLRKHNVLVALSIDGQSHDQHRITPSGHGSLAGTINGLRILQRHDVSIGISCTVTEANIDNLEADLLWLLDNLGAESVDYNILIGSETFDEEYARRASRALLKCFDVARARDVYIDRVMRRVEPFAEGKLNLTDCGGCGQQIVSAPNGRIGCCHAFMSEGEFFRPMEEIDDPEMHELWAHSKQRSPFNIPECLGCEALGICGGGCFYTPYKQTGDIMSVDHNHCELAKATLLFLLKELWHKTQKQ